MGGLRILNSNLRPGPRRGGLVMGSGGAVYNYVLDRFTGTDGTLLTAHPLETGETWTDGGAATHFVIKTNSAVPYSSDVVNADNGKVALATTQSPFGANCVVEILLTRNVVAQYSRGIIGRWTDNLNYWKIVDLTGGNGFRLIEVNNGVETIRAFANISSTVGTPITLRVTFSGATITATLGALATISYASATFNQTADRFGIIGTAYYGVWDYYDYFLLWQSGSPPPNPLYP